MVISILQSDPFCYPVPIPPFAVKVALQKQEYELLAPVY